MAKLRDRLAVLGRERGSAGAATGFESVTPLDLIPAEGEDEEGDEDIGAWSGQGWTSATSGG